MKKILVAGIIISFIGICILPVYAIDTKTSSELLTDLLKNEKDTKK